MAGTVPHPRIPGIGPVRPRQGEPRDLPRTQPVAGRSGEEQGVHVVYREFESSADALGADTDAIDPEATVETVTGALERWGWSDDEAES